MYFLSSFDLEIGQLAESTYDNKEFLRRCRLFARSQQTPNSSLNLVVECCTLQGADCSRARNCISARQMCPIVSLGRSTPRYLVPDNERGPAAAA